MVLRVLRVPKEHKAHLVLTRSLKRSMSLQESAALMGGSLSNAVSTSTETVF